MAEAGTGGRALADKVWRELVNLLQYVVIPGIPVLLPWSLGFRWLLRASAWNWLYQEEADAACAAARAFRGVDDEKRWLRNYRLTRLVDHADFGLTLTRGERWMRRFVRMPLPFPETRSAVGVFFHWGAGFWGIRSLRASGHHAGVLAGRFSPASMGAWVAYAYGHARIRQLQRCAGRALVYAPGSVRRSLALLADGDWVVGTPDVPPDDTRLGEQVLVWGRRARFPKGLVHIAERAGVPLVVFTTALDLATGHREVRVLDEIDPKDPDAMQRIMDHWQTLIDEQPWAFGLWGRIDAFFPPAAAGA